MASSAGDMVIQLRVQQRSRYLWSAITGAVVVGCVLTIIFDRSWGTAAFAAVLLGLFAWIWGTEFAARRARGDTVNQLVLTGDGIRSPLFSLDWGSVARVWIGATSAQTGSLRALFIEPLRASDVQWARSRTIGVSRWLTAKMGQPQLRVLQANVDLPLEQLLAEMERRAGRSLT